MGQWNELSPRELGKVNWGNNNSLSSSLRIKKITHKNIIVQLLKTKDKGKSLKSIRGKRNHIIFKGMTERLTDDFSEDREMTFLSAIGNNN